MTEKRTEIPTKTKNNPLHYFPTRLAFKEEGGGHNGMDEVFLGLT